MYNYGVVFAWLVKLSCLYNLFCWLEMDYITNRTTNMMNTRGIFIPDSGTMHTTLKHIKDFSNLKQRLLSI